MKKIFLLIFFFLLLYIGLRIGYRFYGSGHQYVYSIETDGKMFEIDETFTNAKTNSNYYLQIKKDDKLFFYQTFVNFKNKAKIIKDIYYYEDDKYQCILPIYLNNVILSDILCKTNNGYSYFYHALRGVNEKLDDFASSLTSIGYNINQWIDSTSFYENNGIKSYMKNIPSNHFIMLSDYKGLILANAKNNKFNYISLFELDVYQKKLNFLYKSKYIVPNYNSKYRFHEFYVIDITTGQREKIVSDYELSFDSYFQGVFEDKIYFFDRSSKKQFALNMKDYTITEVGNESVGIKIYNGYEWEYTNAITASKEEMIFTDEDNLLVEDTEYVKIQKYGTGKYGYYYYYKEIDDKYLVYRSNIQSPSQLVYLFSTTNLDNIHISHRDVYFIDEEYIKKYSDEFGIRKILEYKELKYNDNLYFGVYQKR